MQGGVHSTPFSFRVEHPVMNRPMHFAPAVHASRPFHKNADCSHPLAKSGR